MHVHIGCRRKNEQAGTVNRPVCRDAGTDMAYGPLRYRDIRHPPVRKSDVLQEEGGTRFHGTHFFLKSHKDIGRDIGMALRFLEGKGKTGNQQLFNPDNPIFHNYYR
jgi:hypothetical protein